MNRFLVPIALAAFAIPAVARADLPPDVAKAVAAMGHVNDAQATRKIFDPIQPKEPAASLKADRDIAYGTDPLQKLDVVWDGKTAGARPILVFVHGGGFTGGDKHSPNQFTYDNIMKWANDQGMVGVEINYRLAPKNKYPDAAYDARDALAWVAKNAAKYGGDPNKIFLWGHSAGASLVGIYVSHPEFHYKTGGGIIGAVMTSGGYQFRPNAFIADEETAKKAASVEGLKATKIPLFFTRAEWDPETPQIAQGEMINKVLTEAGHEHGWHVMKTHNHMSQVYSVGTTEHQLTDLLGPWFKEHAANVKSASN